MKYVSTLREYMAKNHIKAARLAELSRNTTNRINGWLKTAKPWEVSNIAGKLYAHPPGRLVDLEPGKGNSGLRADLDRYQGKVDKLQKEIKKLQKEVDRLKRKK